MLSWQSSKTQWLGFFLGFLLISFFTLMPMDELPPAPGSDKLHHIIGFGGWAFLCAFGPRRSFYLMALCIVLWGGAIELIQPYVNRHREFADFVADACGVVLVSIIRIKLAKQNA